MVVSGGMYGRMSGVAQTSLCLGLLIDEDENM